MNNQTSLTALVTGATGFLGAHLCNQLLSQGWQVYALCRSPEKSNALPKAVQVVIGDVLNTDDFEKHLPENLDAIFHTAASTNTWFKNNEMQTNTNINGTKNMLRLAKKYKVNRYIHISSVVVFGIHKELNNIVESMPKAGKDSFINYLQTKTASEENVLNTKKVDSVIINPTHIIGPGDKNNWARLIKMIAAKKLPSIPNGAGSFVDVRDVASGIIQAYYHGKIGNNYLLGGTDMNFKEFITKVANKLQVKPTSIQLPNSLLMSLAHLKNLISRFTNKEPDITPESVSIISDLYACDSAKARADLDYKNRDFDVTLNDTLNFMKDEDII
jgi:nucleoside-diphosphate-sugar epimerase